ncbi:MAG: phosphoribosylformylglycinamidine cyclo-ligase [Deltaproteobacteria bacterium]|nr:phosphoribosylformylglycinamidine cyclo-ligase [Deltaproteobacteria bacterium]
MSSGLNYKEAGVDIDAGNAFVNSIKESCRSTHRNEVLNGLGGFSGLFALNMTRMKEPVLVAATDGVGTKLKLALETDLVDGLGQDLVAMCVNDLICCGAEPLFFLDYLATAKLDIERSSRIIKNMCAALKDINCALLGGETAEMPGLYQPGDFDLAGFAVGWVDRSKIIEGLDVKLGYKIIGLKSSGVHSNGFSLVRKILAEKNIDPKSKSPFSSRSLAEDLLEPTIIYVKEVLALIKNFKIGSLAHITGGGLPENLPRVLPKQSQALLYKNKISRLPIFEFLQDAGGIADEEMWRVFNQGIGFTLVVSPNDEAAILDHIKGSGLEGACIGEIKRKDKDTDPGVVFSA